MSQDILEELRRRFPDLSQCTNHFGMTVYISEKVNACAEGFDLIHSYDEPGSIIEIWPYVTVCGTKVYSIPAGFLVGYHNPYGYGDIPMLGWIDTLQQYGISQEVITKVETYFARHQPVEDKGD